MRRLLGAGRPAGARRLRRHRVDRDQRLPGPGRRPRRPGGRHGRGARHARRPAPGPARDGGARRLAVRLLHARASSAAWPRSSTAPDRRPPTAPEPDAYHGDNGFDLHALSGNLCRCTGYRPIKDAAYALGFPAADDELAARRAAPAPAPSADPAARRRGRQFVRPADLAEALRLLAERPRRHRRRRQHRLGRRRQPRGRRAPAGRGRRPAARAARLRGRPTTRSRIGAALTLTEIERRLGRPAAAAGARCSRSSPRG